MTVMDVMIDPILTDQPTIAAHLRYKKVIQSHHQSTFLTNTFHTINIYLTTSKNIQQQQSCNSPRP